MNPDETLPCRDCGKAIALVSLAGVPRYGHLVNPTFMHHEAMPPRVRLARSAIDRSLFSAGERRSRIEGSATRREDAANAGPSHSLTTNGTRAASKGSARSRISPSGISVQLPAEGGSQWGDDPYTAPTLRPRQAAGRP